MRLAYIIFDGITWLDLIGVYDTVGRLRTMGYLPDLSWHLCGFTSSSSDHHGLHFTATEIRPNLASYDAIIVPGGYGTRALQKDPEMISWLQTASTTSLKISVCTGSLLLGAAGFLRDKAATTNFAEYDTLRPYCREVIKQKIVEDGNVITAGAVSSSIDLGLLLCRKWAGDDAAEEIRKRIDYHPAPAGSRV